VNGIEGPGEALDQGPNSRKKELSEVMAMVRGFWVPKSVQAATPDTSPVCWRLKPGPFDHDTMALLPLRAMSRTGGTLDRKLSAVAPPG
jgi:hypothetical protein